jgi:hypothetical protein
MEKTVDSVKNFFAEDKTKKACIAVAALGLLGIALYSFSSREPIP